MKVAVLLGGPSEERAISLNSARSVMDHLEGDGIEIHAFVYFDSEARPYAISRPMLYSNTPSDFDFKLAKLAEPLDDSALRSLLTACDIVFPVMHGRFGEDGQIQQKLEEMGVPYVGSDPSGCAVAFDKYRAHKELLHSGIQAIRTEYLRPSDTGEVRDEAIRWALELAAFVVLKPSRGGSSIDVHVAGDAESARACVDVLLKRHDRVLVQPKVEGSEFTVIVVDRGSGPVALVPTEIEVRGDSEAVVFDYRRKYLASNDSTYYCPPRFGVNVVQRIRAVCEQAFRVLNLRDFARVDGWLCPDGSILVADVNPISGMEQNSFLFIQGAHMGLNHHDMLRLVVTAAAERAGIASSVSVAPTDSTVKRKRKVGVIFGGSTAERQVSLLSGTNVWLKLLRSTEYEPVPHLLDVDGSVWQVSYESALRHTVEDVSAMCRRPSQLPSQLESVNSIRRSLRLSDVTSSAQPSQCQEMSMAQFLESYDLVFNCLHGGAGEDGTFQRQLDAAGVKYNGSGAEASSTCMDKYASGIRLQGLEASGISIPKRTVVETASLVDANMTEIWSQIVGACDTEKIIVKPLSDGCSAAVVPLLSSEELSMYVKHTLAGSSRIVAGTFSALAPDQVVEMSTSVPKSLLFEEFVETDSLVIEDSSNETGLANDLEWAKVRDTGWVEVTVGVLGRERQLVAFPPSITVARRGVLSVEEKFMGGTGVNLTPPPAPPEGLVLAQAVKAARERIELVADRLGLAGYGRIDAFMHRETGDLKIIEANTLPALTPSTVLFHQALAAQPPLTPTQLLEHILGLAEVGEPPLASGGCSNGGLDTVSPSGKRSLGSRKLERVPFEVPKELEGRVAVFNVLPCLPRGWENDLANAKKDAKYRSQGPSPKSVTRELEQDELDWWRVDARAVLLHMPYLRDLYAGPFRRAVSSVAGKTAFCASNPTIGGVINLQRRHQRFECHVDTNLWTAVLFFTEHPPGEGALVIGHERDLYGVPAIETRGMAIEPKCGILVVFEGGLLAHYARPITQAEDCRASFVTNFYFDEDGWRESDRDEELHAQRLAQGERPFSEWNCV